MDIGSVAIALVCLAMTAAAMKVGTRQMMFSGRMAASMAR